MIRFMNIFGMLKLQEKFNSSSCRLQQNLFWMLILTGYCEKLGLNSSTVIFLCYCVMVLCSVSRGL